MNIKLLLIAVLFFWGTHAAHAQSEDLPPEEKRHWEVGIDLLPLINKETLPTTSVFGRYHFTTPAGRDMAVRLRVGMDFLTSDTTTSPPSNYLTTRKTGFLIRTGVEVQKKAACFYLYSGCDVSVSYQQIYSDGKFDALPPIYYSSNDQTWTPALHPFLGLRYQLKNRVSFSIETAMNLSYVWNHLYYESGGGFGGSTTRRFEIGFQPISVLNASYHF